MATAGATCAMAMTTTTAGWTALSRPLPWPELVGGRGLCGRGGAEGNLSLLGLKTDKSQRRLWGDKI